MHSSNVGAARVGLALGPERFSGYIHRFGFGQRSGVPLPGEEIGLVHRSARWSQLENATISMGQGISVTPLQVTSAICTVANGGVRLQPRVVEKVVDAKGRTIYTPPQVAPVRVISERTAAVLNEILKSVVARGTGMPAALTEHVVAGKTGTAQKAGRGGYSADKFVASFGGYVPADRPRLAILVVVDEPRGAQYGGTVAAPAFREIAESSLRYLGVAPSIPARTVNVAPPMLATFSQHRAVKAGSEVPDLRGLDARAAVALATAAGFRVRASGSGVVQTQQPLPGEALPLSHERQQVVLTLAEGTR
jgi:cell division protein FtsI (penicillin-binding protein 3)